MNNNQKLTIIIPTWNRNFFLSKQLDYYGQDIHDGHNRSLKFIIGDGSETATYEKNSRLIERHSRVLDIVHLKQPSHLTNYVSTLYMLEEVKTPYCVWTGDDDFLVPRQLKKCVDFLELHPDYNLACGTTAKVSLEVSPDKRLKVVSARPGSHRIFSQDRPSQRLYDFAPGMFVTTYSVERTVNAREIYKKCFEMKLSEDVPHGKFHEICHSVISLIRGKQAMMEGLYGVILHHSIMRGSSARLEQFIDLLKIWNWKEQIDNGLHWWAEELSLHEKMDFKKAQEIALAIFYDCCVFHMKRHSDVIAQRDLLSCDRFLRRLYARLYRADISSLKRLWIKWKLGWNELPLSVLLHPKSKYYNDFVPIYRILKEGG